MKTALFDLDGTLIASVPDLAAAINLTRADFGLPAIPEETIRDAIGEGMRSLVQRTIPELRDRLDELLATQKRNYAEHCLDKTRLYPDTKETLLALREAGWKLALVTNKPAELTGKIVDGLGLAPLLDVVIGGGDAPTLKPDPESLFLAAERMSVQLDETDWMIGDNFTDLQAAKRAGIRSCYCRFGFGDPRNESYTAVVDSMRELRNLLLVTAAGGGSDK